MPSYLDYNAVPDDNEGGSVPTRFPEGNFKGTWVNLCFRYMAAVVRLLGDSAAKLPLDDEGDPVTTNGGKVGTLAFQNRDAVDITGGILTGVRGAMPIASLCYLDMTWAGYQAVYQDYLMAGWVICDGRTVVNPYNNTPVVMPNYVGRYLRMYATTAGLLQTFGATTQPTTATGSHNHGGNSGSTILTAANLPIGTASQPKSGDLDTITGAASQTATGHTHTIATASDHTHQVDMLPLSVNVIIIKRVW